MNANDKTSIGGQPRATKTTGPLWRVIRLGLVCYLAVILVMMLFERSFIFVPSSASSGEWGPPGLEFDNVDFRSADGTKLHGWYVPHERPRAVVLFCHGNAGNVTHRAAMLRDLHDRAGLAVMIFDYRGYGRSEGKPDEDGVLADARAARAWLAEHEGIAESDIVIMGRSLGGAVAVDLAARDGARALVIESTFTSIPDMAARSFPWLPVRWLVRTQLDSLEKIPDYSGPLLQTHGDADTLIPFEYGRRLFDAAESAEPRKFIRLPGLDHNDAQPARYYEQLAAFLDEL